MYLNTHTYYSLRYGTISPKNLVEKAFQLGISTLVLTDINSTSANLEFVQLAKKMGIKPILGIDFRNGAQQQFILIAKNNKGLHNINAYLSELLHSAKTTIPNKAKKLPDTYVIYPFENNISDLNDNEYIGIKPSDLNHLKFSEWRFQQEKLVILQPVSFHRYKAFRFKPFEIF